jgi:hypothetical protein
MELFSVLALIFITLAAYSAGVAAAVRDRALAPLALDLILILALWSGGLVLRGEVGRWPALGAGLVAGLVCGAVRAGLRMRRDAPALDLARSAGEPDGGWRAFAVRLGNFQGRMLMAFFYFIVVTPFALIARFAMKPLPREPGSYWIRRSPAPGPELERARRQY